MKKTLLIILSIFMIFGGLKAQKGHISEVEAIHFLNKTNNIMRITRNKIVIHKVYTGGLAAAKAYQKRAIIFYKNGNKRKAINQSYIARRLSFRAFVANTKRSIPEVWKLTPHEKRLVTVRVTRQKLNKILLKEYIIKEKKADFNLNDVSDVK